MEAYGPGAAHGQPAEEAHVIPRRYFEHSPNVTASSGLATVAEAKQRGLHDDDLRTTPAEIRAVRPTTSASVRWGSGSRGTRPSRGRRPSVLNREWSRSTRRSKQVRSRPRCCSPRTTSSSSRCPRERAHAKVEPVGPRDNGVGRHAEGAPRRRHGLRENWANTKWRRLLWLRPSPAQSGVRDACPKGCGGLRLSTRRVLVRSRSRGSSGRRTCATRSRRGPSRRSTSSSTRSGSSRASACSTWGAGPGGTRSSSRGAASTSSASTVPRSSSRSPATAAAAEGLAATLRDARRARAWRTTASSTP